MSAAPPPPAAPVSTPSVITRGLARAIDTVLAYFIAVIVIRVAFPDVAIASAFGSERADTAIYVIAAVVWVGFFAVFESMNGRTPGKAIVGIRAVDRDGSRLSAGGALVRNLVLVVPVLWLVALLTILMDSRQGRGFHDRLGRSKVVVGQR